MKGRDSSGFTLMPAGLNIQTMLETDGKFGMGIQGIAEFFAIDTYIVEQCHDDMGYGLAFDTATDLFVRYAKQYDDKETLAGMVVDICASDEYGVREVLVKAAHNFLSDAELRNLAGEFGQRDSESQPYEAHSWLKGRTLIARQLYDPFMYEQSVRANGGDAR